MLGKKYGAEDFEDTQRLTHLSGEEIEPVILDLLDDDTTITPDILPCIVSYLILYVAYQFSFSLDQAKRH